MTSPSSSDSACVEAPSIPNASVENIIDDPTPLAPEPGPSTGSWATHTTGSSEFQPIDAEADIERINIVESLCMNCGKDGITRMLLTSIPYFRDVVVMSFECEHCHARHAEIQPANELADKAVKFVLKTNFADAEARHTDLNRQLIKSETCRLLIPELEFEIPPNTRRGDIITVEGILRNVADSLQVGQAERVLADPETAQKVSGIISEFTSFADGEKDFTLILDDLAGNSFLENPNAPAPDPRVQTIFYERTREQTIEMGYAVAENQDELKSLEEQTKSVPASSLPPLQGNKKEPKGYKISKLALDRVDTYFNVSDRSAVLHGVCAACQLECETRMCVTDIPHFKDVVLMVTDCNSCGYRDAEIKPIGTMSEKGTKITLTVTSVDDMKRDILKSDTASCAIPELELELMSGTLGGKYTTLEGIIEDIKNQLMNFNPFALGDSSQDAQRTRMQAIIEQLGELPSVSSPWTFVLDDPLSNIYIYSPLGNQDPNMKIETYERSFEQNEELGLNDIDVDDYMTEEQKREMEADMERERLQKAAEAAAAKTNQDSDEKAVEEDPIEQAAKRFKELKASKIGGLISVEHKEIDEILHADNKISSQASSSSSTQQQQ